MQVQQLAYFLAVAEARHFTRAADVVGVSQPTLSKQVRALENSLGTALFTRTRHGAELTSAGETLLPHARRIVIDVANAERAVHEIAQLRRGRVRLGATPSMIDGLLPDVLREFRLTYPDIELEVQEAGSRVLTDHLLAGRLDIAVLIVPLAVSSPDIETHLVFRERLVLASPRDAWLGEEVAVTDLNDLPLVMFREGYDLRDVTVRACNRAGFEPRFAVEGGEMGAVLRFVEAGLGHAVVPEIVLSSRTDLARSWIVEPPLAREVAVAHRDVSSLPLAARTFRDLLLRKLG
ncbi:LysR family transcriptional regulator [Aeromicrobium sp. YIM 150415]|uniref:LysR family transcriptional regulator n=1 Tax=Aeromicrobium piscarium TaxID=2590901 RepID=A0A554SPZ6_9ACTN|nr:MULTISPECIES: LysR substrate-binding domain-containing protein [Aeromicrobium]MBM9462119.1 LysR family transcriptional regulator [Aeromicrobium sp. YIM 150415]TSD68414.1 LysR family transcriptional regulator [Aeromicrobium piscarium]